MNSNLSYEFLLLHYPNIDFLISSSEIQETLYIRNFREIQGKNKYFAGIAEYKKGNILIADFQNYLNKTFKLIVKSDFHVAIVYNAGSSGLFKDIAGEFSGWDGSSIGLIVTNSFELKEIPLGEIKLIPESIRKKNFEHGILGVRFLDDKKNQYYLDMKNTIKNLIQGVN